MVATELALAVAYPYAEILARRDSMYTEAVENRSVGLREKATYGGK